MTIRPMRASEEPAVRSLFAACHPGWPPPHPHFFFLNPTLVALEGRTVVGFTSCRLNTGPDDVVSLYGVDVCVIPAHRGRGLGHQLHEARLVLGREAGARHFVGMARRDNLPMLAIFRAHGMRELITVPGHYHYDTPPADGVAYIGEMP